MLEKTSKEKDTSWARDPDSTGAGRSDDNSSFFFMSEDNKLWEKACFALLDETFSLELSIHSNWVAGSASLQQFGHCQLPGGVHFEHKQIITNISLSDN